MSTSSLTTKYRPQTFADVAGQEAVKAILSRAAQQDKVAPAYLFSGTRGVGKTTIARIFAKALNCVEAPTGEPCNKCDHCRQITAGVAVDVVEIDGASNRGIDDARRLKEDIGYAPIECRYKVFIIDEAHMLTREAFNALLKTLEEPPPRATFIMATTESHKFPATIISRCQHYTFKMLSQDDLTSHLEKIMGAENLAYDPGALSIIARRGAGSVRDSMSLLGQALAMGGDKLSEENVRSFLGLAGQDVFFRLMDSMHQQNLVGVGMLLREVLDQGLDIGFFLRELTACWRNMFLIKQAGDAALPLLDMSGEEAAQWKGWADRFGLQHIHACWQLTMDGQRRVMGSLEPAMSLELMLLNLASLPQLIDLEKTGAPQRGPAGAPGNPGPAGGRGGQGGPRPGGGRPMGAPQGAPQGGPGRQFAPSQSAQAPHQPRPQAPASNSVPPWETQNAAPSNPAPVQQAPAAPVRPQNPAPVSHPRETKEADPSVSTSVNDSNTSTSELPSPPTGRKDWHGFVTYAGHCGSSTGVRLGMLRQAQGALEGDVLRITCMSRVLHRQLSTKDVLNLLGQVAAKYFGPSVTAEVGLGDIKEGKTEKQLWLEAEQHEGVNTLMKEFSAQLVAVKPRSPAA